jgi:hypothetical protein
MVRVWARGAASPFVLALVLGVATHAVSAQAAPKEQVSEEARSYFRNGVELLQANPPNYQDAYHQFKLAFDKSNSWKVLGNMGLCAMNLERDGEALRYYEEYLKRGGDDINKDERSAIQRDILLLRGNAASVELSVVGSDPVEVFDVRAGSSNPAQTYVIGEEKQTLVLRAGTHTLTATHKDGRSLKWEVILNPSKTASHEFDFTAPPPETPKASSEPKQEAPPPETAVVLGAPSEASPRKTIGYVVGGVGVAGLVAGGIFGFLAISAKNSQIENCESAANCPDYAAASSAHDRAERYGTLSTVALIAGSAATAVGVVLIATAKTDSQSARLTLVPSAGPSAAGMQLKGTF